jgi:amidase
MDDDLCFTPAVELARRLHARELSARELLDAYLDRIHRVNPAINAIVTLAEEQAALQAAEADDTAARGAMLGPLHGLPIAVKDLADEHAGVRCGITDVQPGVRRNAQPVESAAHPRR